MAHISAPLVFLDDGRAYTLEVILRDQTSYVTIVDDLGHGVVTFVGGGQDLHGLFLGLHNVMVDAGRSPDGRAVLLMPARPEVVDHDEDDAGGYTSGQA